MHVKVENGIVVQAGLPEFGVLRDGRTVSNFDLLDEETLISEGWLPLEHDIPEYDDTTEIIQHDRYEIFDDRVVVKYAVVNKPVPDIESVKQAKIEELRNACNSEILGGFYSSAKNGNRLYGFDLEDQLNISSLKNDVMQGLIQDGTLEYYAKGQSCEIWSNAEFMQLYQEAMNFKVSRIKKFKDILMPSVMSSTSIDEVNSISWNMDL